MASPNQIRKYIKIIFRPSLTQHGESCVENMFYECFNADTTNTTDFVTKTFSPEVFLHSTLHDIVLGHKFQQNVTFLVVVMDIAWWTFKIKRMF